MNKGLILIATVAAFTFAANAQDDEYKALMKSVPPTVGLIRNAADDAAAASAATKLADTFDKMAAFWKTKNADDAVKLAETGRDAAKAIASGTGDKADHVKEIQGICGPCHMAHRAGTAPNFTIK